MTKMEIIVSFTSLLLNQRFSPNLTSSQCRFMFSPLHFLSVFSLVFLTTPTENVWKFFPQKICVYIVLLTQTNVEIDNGSLMKPKRFVKPKFDQIGKEKNLLLILQFGAISSCQVHKNNFVLIVFIVIITEHTVLKGKKLVKQDSWIREIKTLLCV